MDQPRLSSTAGGLKLMLPRWTEFLATILVLLAVVPSVRAAATTNSVPPTQVTLPVTPVVFSSGNGNLISVGYGDMGAVISLELAGGSGGILLQSVAGLTKQFGNNGSGFMNYKGTVTAINAALSHLTYYPPGDGSSGVIIVSTYDSTNTLDQDYIGILVNNAPTFIAGETLPSVDEGTVNPAGETITTLLGAEFVDANSNTFAGIALVADASDSGTQGNWEYSTDAGVMWFDVGSVSTAAGLLLDPSAKLRFVPLGAFTGTPGALTVHAIDNSVATTFTSGATRSVFDTTADNASSRVAETGVFISTSISVIGTNDAPLGRSKAVATNESTAYPFSETDFGFSDVDVGDTLSAVRIDSLPLAGSLTLSGVPVTATQVIATANIANLVFTPATHANGARYASFTFSVSDQSSEYDPVPNTLTVNVTAVYASITSVSVPSNGTYVAGAAMDFTVNFSEAITVTGTPALRPSIGSFGSVNAGYISGSGTTALIFRYTVASHILDTDGFAITTLNTNGGTLKDVFGDNATLTLNNVGSTAGVLVNGGLPGVLSVAVPANVTYVAGGNLDFTVNFSEAITVDTTGGTPRIALTLDTGGVVYAGYLSGSGNNGLIFRYTVADGNLDTNGIVVGSLSANGGTLKDASANDATLTLNNLGSTTAVLIEAVVPRIGSITRQTPATSPTGADSLVFRVGFSEPVANVDAADFGVSGTTATVTNVASSASDTYDITVSGGDLANLDGTVTLSFAGGQNIADLAGNALTNLTPTGTNANTYAISNNIAPTFNDGATQTLTINEDGSAASLADLLDVVDAATSQTLTWSVTSAPAKGALGGFPITAGTAGTATPIAPAGLTYTPGANQNGSDSFTIQVSDGIATDSITVNVTIAAVSDAPTLTGTVVTINSLAEDAATPSGAVGQLVSALTGSFNDADGDPAGIAVTGVNANGSLWYSTNNGTTWTRLTGTVSVSSALMLYADTTTRIHFVPVANFSGTVSDAISFRAWDRTGGIANGQSGLDLVANTLTEVAVIATGGSARSVAVAGNYAYVADESTGLVVFDISDPDQPAKLSVLAVGGMAQGVAVSGSHVYVANGLGLVAVDVSNASVPAIVGTYIGTGTFGRVAVSGNFAYVAKAGWQQGLAVIDISNPTAPQLRGTRPVASVVYHVAVSGNYAYLADEQTGMVIMNISNPDNPTIVSTVDTSGYPHAVAISGNYAYVADSSGGVATIEISGPSYAIADTQATPGFAYGVAISEGRAYIADQTVGLVVIDISNPLALSLAGQYAAPGAGNDVAVGGSHIHLAMRIRGDQMAEPPTDDTGALAVIRLSSLAGSISSQSATAEIQIAAVNDAPAGADKTVAANEDTALVFAAADFGFTDPTDSPASNHLSLKITTLPGVGTLTSNGVAVNAGDFVTKVDIDLNRLVFTPAANGHASGYASFTFQVRDDGGTANGGVDLDASANMITVDVTAANDAPVGTATGGTTAFVEGNNVSSVPVVIDSGVTLSDIDNATLAGATVSITSNLQSAEDVLGFVNDSSTMGNISGNYASSTGVLTLTSSGATATIAEWQSALRVVTYTNSSEAPNATTRTISFVVNDGATASSPTTRSVSVTATNDTPTDLALSALTVNQSGGTNATVGTLSTTDLDDTVFVYTLVAGTGATDNASFNLSGSTLRATAAASFASGTKSVRVRTTDAGSLTYEEAFILTVTDNVAPTPTTVTGPADGTYGSGENLDFTVTFSEVVNVTGTPVLNLMIGATAGTAEYLSGTGTTMLRFRHVVQPGEYAAAGELVIGALALVGGAITDVNANPASLTLTAPALPNVIVEARNHTADTNRDRKISLLELLRVIDLYNTRTGTTRTGDYHDDNGTTDGFASGTGTLTRYHSADSNQDGKLSLIELLRVIDLYNTRSGTTRTGDYHPQNGTVDGYAPGL